MQAVVVDPNAPARLALGPASPPTPDSSEAIVAVRAFSLNRGEIGFAAAKPGGARIGWDVAGVVQAAAADGTGPGVGTRVVGFVPAANGWAEEVAVPTSCLAEIPDGVSDADAAALPVAGLTALYGLERGSRLLGARVLVTGASGGVGLFACQLARHMGANVVAQLRDDSLKDRLESLGVEVVIDATGEVLSDRGPYRLIFDAIGGPILTHCLPKLTTGGRAVLYGVTAAPTAELAIGPLLGSGDAVVEGFNLYHESRVEPASSGLRRLLRLVRDDSLQTFIERTGSWTEVGQTAADLMSRRFRGKAVLEIG